VPLTLWSCRTRLTAPRLVWCGSNYPLHETRRMERRRLRGWTRLGQPREGRIEASRKQARMFGGRLGEWPLWRPDRHRRRR
jgi:hypothetical protein